MIKYLLFLILISDSIYAWTWVTPPSSLDCSDSEKAMQCYDTTTKKNVIIPFCLNPNYKPDWYNGGPQDYFNQWYHGFPTDCSYADFSDSSGCYQFGGSALDVNCDPNEKFSTTPAPSNPLSAYDSNPKECINHGGMLSMSFFGHQKCIPMDQAINDAVKTIAAIQSSFLGRGASFLNYVRSALSNFWSARTPQTMPQNVSVGLPRLNKQNPSVPIIPVNNVSFTAANMEGRYIVNANYERLGNNYFPVNPSTGNPAFNVATVDRINREIELFVTGKESFAVPANRVVRDRIILDEAPQVYETVSQRVIHRSGSLNGAVSTITEIYIKYSDGSQRKEFLNVDNATGQGVFTNTVINQDGTTSQTLSPVKFDTTANVVPQPKPTPVSYPVTPSSPTTPPPPTYTPAEVPSISPTPAATPYTPLRPISPNPVSIPNADPLKPAVVVGDVSSLVNQVPAGESPHSGLGTDPNANQSPNTSAGISYDPATSTLSTPENAKDPKIDPESMPAYELPPIEGYDFFDLGEYVWLFKQIANLLKIIGTNVGTIKDLIEHTMDQVDNGFQPVIFDGGQCGDSMVFILYNQNVDLCSPLVNFGSRFSSIIAFFVIAIGTLTAIKIFIFALAI